MNEVAMFNGVIYQQLSCKTPKICCRFVCLISFCYNFWPCIFCTIYLSWSWHRDKRSAHVVGNIKKSVWFMFEYFNLVIISSSEHPLESTDYNPPCQYRQHFRMHYNLTSDREINSNDKRTVDASTLSCDFIKQHWFYILNPFIWMSKCNKLNYIYSFDSFSFDRIKYFELISGTTICSNQMWCRSITLSILKNMIQ